MSVGYASSGVITQRFIWYVNTVLVLGTCHQNIVTLYVSGVLVPRCGLP